ncbi:MAG: hypothetical protein WDZ56_01970 [Candidatus Paceibacterota bacterium]
MSIAFYLMLASGFLLITLFFLFKAESVKGRRVVLGSVRGALDLKLSEHFKDKYLWRKYIGASSFRLLFHFVLHHVISATLFIIKSVEDRLRKLKRHNRLIAKNISSTGSSHLRSVAKHKEETALSPEEKEARNERSLND